MRVNPPGVEFFYAAQLVRLETCGVSDYILDGSGPPITQLTRAWREMDNSSEAFRNWIRVEVTGGVMRAVGFRRRCFTLDVALRYRFA